jgi:DNA-binding transcriptional MerR regulator
MPEVGRNPSDRSYLSIREVLDLLVEEFPDITISKIRFLESRGLIHPERTPSGYRKFYDTDVERLRWILRQQREHFLPLKVIKGRLDRESGTPEPESSEPSLFDTDIELSSDGVPAEWHPSVPRVESEPVTPVVRVEQRNVLAPPVPTRIGLPESPPAPPAERGAPARPVPGTVGRRRSDRPADRSPGLSLTEMAAAIGGSISLVAQLEDFGLISSTVVGGVPCYDEDAVAIARIAARFEQFGIEPRHLSALKRSAERQAGLFGQVVAPLLRQRNPAARERAQTDLEEMAQLGQAIEALFLHGLLGDLTGR